MNLEDEQQPSGSGASGGTSSNGAVGGQDTNGNPAASAASNLRTSSGNNLGARPKVRRNVISVRDQVVPNENHEDNDEAEENNSDEDFYVYR